MKMYCVFSLESLAEIKGIRGKLAAQAGHAYLHSFWDAARKYPAAAEAYQSGKHAKKICLVAKDNAELLELVAAYKDICGTTVVVDAGFTVFSQPTLTCVGIGPIAEEDIQSNIKSLKLLT